ncbi:PREDICTED: tetraspanin-3-like [Nanorana parkeri]|uniref:tetraspanin-3-like n=1 Tax=Nanorana parkeri TaxID=125878 RepID=UPI0008544792|nr:PREDICTED: tetraspanin-3-like [Nanorana parkeri]XP_018416522.1 PREDICTED: tetraspanin-3-like [Nanorana parkeri]
MGVGSCTSKTFLILISLIFLAAAAALAYVGINAIVTYKQYENVVGNMYVMLPAVIILCVAVFMLIIGCLGFCSTIQESCCGLGCFITLISIILVAGVASLVLGLVYKDKINPELEKNMDILFKSYDGKNIDSSGVDFIQEELHCCGIKNYTSWQNTTWFKTNHTVPKSCCMKNATHCTGDLKELDQIYTKGCEAEVEDLLQRVLGVSMLIILGFVIVELICLISLCVVYRKRNSWGYETL